MSELLSSTHFLGCALFTGGDGLQTYCVNVTTNDGRLTALPACVTTQPGRKLIKATVTQCSSDTPPSYTCVYIECSKRWTSVKAGAHTCFGNLFDIHKSTEHVWAPPLTEVQRYSALNAKMLSKYNLRMSQSYFSGAWLIHPSFNGDFCHVSTYFVT